MLSYTIYKNKNSRGWVTFIHGAGGSSSIWFRQIRAFKNEFNIKRMYGKHYGYETSKSALMVKHLKEKILRFRKKGYLKSRNYVIDIGSNDGVGLLPFKN